MLPKRAAHPPTCLDILLARRPPPQLKNEVGQVGRPAEQAYPRRWSCVWQAQQHRCAGDGRGCSRCSAIRCATKFTEAATLSAHQSCTCLPSAASSGITLESCPLQGTGQAGEALQPSCCGWQGMGVCSTHRVCAVICCCVPICCCSPAETSSHILTRLLLCCAATHE